MTNLRYRALDLLANREHSRVELQRKLQRHSDNEADVAAVLTQLVAENLQSDERYCENYVRYRSNRGIGPQKIAAELQGAGISADLINQYLYRGSIDWHNRLQCVWRKKFSGVLPRNSREHGQHVRFLLQRGFEPEAVHRLLKR